MEKNKRGIKNMNEEEKEIIEMAKKVREFAEKNPKRWKEIFKEANE